MGLSSDTWKKGKTRSDSSVKLQLAEALGERGIVLFLGRLGSALLNGFVIKSCFPAPVLAN